MSKIIELRTENVKRLRAVNIKPDGSLVIIGGDNEQGKSSVLDAIAMALGGKEQVPPVPIRRGETKASIVVDLGDIIVRRTFTLNGGSSLVIEDKDKKRFPSPQALLDSLTGRLTFDPLSFLTLKPKEQLEALKDLVGLDFTADDQERERTYNERTVVNREVERAQMTLSTLPHYPEVSTPVNLLAINSEMDEAQKHNQKLSALQLEASTKLSAATSGTATIAQAGKRKIEILAEIEELKRKLADQEAYILRVQQTHENLVRESDDARKALEGFKEWDVKPIQQKLLDAQEQNEKYKKNLARLGQATTLKEKQAESAKLTKAIEDIDERKQKKLSAAKFPVEGLSFGSGEVMFDGLPFSQASQAQRMRVSVGMAAAMNPKLRVSLVRDGSLLDKKSLALLAELATEHDLQVLIERVGTSDPSAIIIEDGMVKGAKTAEPAKEQQEEIRDLIL